MTITTVKKQRRGIVWTGWIEVCTVAAVGLWGIAGCGSEAARRADVQVRGDWTGGVARREAASGGRRGEERAGAAAGPANVEDQTSEDRQRPDEAGRSALRGSRERRGRSEDSGPRARAKRLETLLAPYLGQVTLDAERCSALNRLARTLATNPHPLARNGKMAVRLAKEVCRHGERPEHLETLAAAYAEAGDFAAALEAVERAVRLARGERSVELARKLELRRRAYRAGVVHYEPAAEPFEPGPPESPGDALRALAYAHCLLGRDCERNDRPRDARAAYRQALEFDRTYRRAHLRLARIHWREGKRRAALRRLVLALKLGGEHPQVLVELAAAFTRLGRASQALPLYRRAMKLAPEEHDVANALAWELATVEAAELRDPAGALALVRQVCEEAGTEKPEYLDTLAAAQAALGQFDAAVETQERALERLLDSGTDQTTNRSRRREAYQLRWRLYVAKRPFFNERRARVELGHLLLAESRYRQAAEEFSKALALDRNDPDLLVTLGRLHHHLGNAEQGNRLLLEALLLEPEMSEVANAVAWNYATAEHPQQRDAEVALSLAERACRLTKRMDPRFLDTLATAYAAAGEYAEAVRAVDEAIALVSSKSGPESEQRLEAYRRRRELYQAERPYRGELRLCADLGEVAWRAGRPEEARRHFEAAAELEPDRVEIRIRLAATYKRLGETRSALKHYRGALELRPDSRAIANALAWELATARQEELRDPGEAVRLARQACEGLEPGQAEYLDTLAAALAAAGRFDEALETIERSIERARQRRATAFLTALGERRERYRSGRAFVQEPTGTDTETGRGGRIASER